jgi:hypothetical protein
MTRVPALWWASGALAALLLAVLVVIAPLGALLLSIVIAVTAPLALRTLRDRGRLQARDLAHLAPVVDLAAARAQRAAVPHP